MIRTVAALYVDERPGGCYVGLPGVEVWGESRNALLYDGEHPVVAHPPCNVWCRLAGLVEARTGIRQGEDGGKFEAALAAVRRCGGVLEHPAWTKAWARYGLLPPVRGWGWRGPDEHGSYTCHVRQYDWGHPAIKPTWILAHGIPRERLPDLRTRRRAGRPAPAAPPAMIGRTYRGQPRPGVEVDKRRRLSKREASATPPAFRDELIRIARLCHVAGGSPSGSGASSSGTS